MANQEHLDILKQGVVVWNKWRKEHPQERPDLSRTNLSRADLNMANLNWAILTGIDLSGAALNGGSLSNADLNNANLNNADLSEADLSGSHFRKAHLREANLLLADLSRTRLIGTDLRESDLFYVNLNNAVLSYADLSGARVDFTIFGNLDLRTVKGLEAIEHLGPSTIGIDTIYKSGGNIPESFLRRAGVPDTFITYMRSLVGKPIEYNSCFISYSSKDQAFAERLYADLQSKNVRCWYAPEHMKIGDRIRPSIDEAIRFHDKLLLVLSASSVESSWVDYEVEKALSRERKDMRTVLFPVRLDDAVIESTTAWAAHIQDTRNIGNFTRWKEHDEYQKGLSRLLRDLKQDTLPDTYVK